MRNNKFIWIILTGLSLCIFSFCTSTTEKNEAAEENKISEELHQAHCDLLANANERLAGINQKVRDLNDKIQNGNKLSDAQNEALDAFEVKQTSINKRMHQIKNVSQENWQSFKTSFEKDLDEAETLIEKVLEDF